MPFGNIGDLAVDEAECRKMFDMYVEAGGNFVDTADCYMGGQSEERIGRFVAERRDRVVVGTKYTFSRNAEDPNAGGNHRKNLNVAVEASLRRLGTDYIDLYYVQAS
jgi:aryl-alcohol dehydrogenase-like predicted oxidoreductase